ncbi:MAG: serine/threonine-protein kinase [Clostridia bacterium]|nr:serine/threonine-protein kinase [Clostridia bacterium]
MSNLADEYELSQYVEIEALDKKGKVYIVKDIRDKSIWVKKEIDEHSLYAYNKIKGNANINIAYVHNVLRCEEKYFVIEEYINGINISDTVEKNGPLELKAVQDIMCQVCDGISCLHKNNVIHRDITPSNVMISVDGVVKIIDLGISRIKKEYKDRDTTIMGTAGYVSPEQFGFSQTDVTSDVYSCGVLMNFMLTGSLPDECRYKGKMDYILNCCMQMNPGARYESIEELKNMILCYQTSKKDFLKFPGFRSNKTWKKIVSAFVYMFYTLDILLLVYSFISEDFDYSDSFALIYMMLFLIPFLAMTNYCYYQERVPFIRNCKKRTRCIIGIVLGIAIGVAIWALDNFLLSNMFYN